MNITKSGPLERVRLDYWTLKEVLNRVLVLLMASNGIRVEYCQNL
jgi:hypothetical protein